MSVFIVILIKFLRILSRTSFKICFLDVYQSMKSVSEAISFIIKWINDENCLRFQASVFLEVDNKFKEVFFMENEFQKVL